MLICERCKRLVRECDAPKYTEDYGVDTGVGYRVLSSETFIDNCHCGGQFIQATRCIECNEYFLATSCFDEICEECLMEDECDKANVN